jgi:dolichol-phosphate mannosyltransferase
LLAGLDDAQPYLRGTIASLGFKQVGVEYTRNARVSGESKFPFSKLVSLALDGILNHSILPLRISTYFGFLVSLLTFLGVILYSMVKLLTHAAWPAGFATLAALILGSISINAMLLGIIGEYLGRMYKQMKKGPLTIVESSIDAYAHPQQKAQPIR